MLSSESDHIAVADNARILSMLITSDLLLDKHVSVHMSYAEIFIG